MSIYLSNSVPNRDIHSAEINRRVRRTELNSLFDFVEYRLPVRYFSLLTVLEEFSV